MMSCNRFTTQTTRKSREVVSPLYKNDSNRCNICPGGRAKNERELLAPNRQITFGSPLSIRADETVEPVKWSGPLRGSNEG